MVKFRRLIGTLVIAGALVSACSISAQPLTLPGNDGSGSGLPTWLACFTSAAAAPTCSLGCVASYNQCKRDYPDRQQCCKDAAVQCQADCQAEFPDDGL